MTRLQAWLVSGALLALLSAAPRAQAQTVTVSDVVSFDGSNNLGAPTTTPAQGRDGKFYGSITGLFDGTAGSIFEFTASGRIKVLYALTGTSGVYPNGLTLGADGDFYGVTIGGGSYNLGTLFKITPSGTYTVLYNFTGGSDGLEPETTPIEASDGNFYGTTNGGCCHSSTVYKYTRAGVFSTIYIYDNAHGIFAGGVMQASDGNLYAVAGSGGVNNNGTIIKLTTTGTLVNYYAFPGQGSGSYPIGLMEASDGNLYGTTILGGVKNNGGIGTIFRYTKQGKLTYLYSFNPKNITGGSQPSSGLFQATDGYLYGLTSSGGTYFNGTLFRISTAGNFQQLYSFSTTIGTVPTANLLQSTSGLMYGSAFNGGPYGFGAIFSVDMGLGPFITFVQPTGKVGHQVQILGQGLTGATSVSFNGVPDTSFSVTSDTYMTAVVPAGATTGPVVVTTPSGTLTSNPVLRITK